MKNNKHKTQEDTLVFFLALDKDNNHDEKTSTAIERVCNDEPITVNEYNELIKPELVQQSFHSQKEVDAYISGIEDSIEMVGTHYMYSIFIGNPLDSIVVKKS